MWFNFNLTLNPLWIRVAYRYFQIILSLKPGEMLLTETLINVLHNGDEVVYYILGLGICVFWCRLCMSHSLELCVVLGFLISWSPIPSDTLTGIITSWITDSLHHDIFCNSALLCRCQMSKGCFAKTPVSPLTTFSMSIYKSDLIFIQLNPVLWAVGMTLISILL